MKLREIIIIILFLDILFGLTYYMNTVINNFFNDADQQPIQT